MNFKLNLFVVSLLFTSVILAHSFTTVTPIKGGTGQPIQPNFSWTYGGAPAAAFKVHISRDPDFLIPDAASKVVTASPSNFIELDGVLIADPTVKYYWYVQACSDISGSVPIGVESNLADGLYFYTLPAINVTVSHPTSGTSISPSSLDFNWFTGNSTNNLRFIVQYFKKSGILPPTATEWATSTSSAPLTVLHYTVINLDAGMKYWFRVLVTDMGTNVLSYSTIGNFTTSGGKSITLTGSWPASPIASTTVVPTLTPELFWYPDQYPAGIKYQLNIVNGGTGAVSNADPSNLGVISDGTALQRIPLDANIPGAAIDALNYTPVTPLMAATTYYWQVRSWDPTGTGSYSGWSAPQKFATYSTSPAPLIMAIPTYPNAGVTVYTTGPTLYWYYPVDMTGISFDVQIKSNDSTWTDPGASVLNNTTEINISTIGITNDNGPGTLTLGGGVTYYWRVRARSATAQGAWSSAQKFIVAGGGASSVAHVTYPLTDPTIYTTKPSLYWYLEGSSNGISGFVVKYSTTDHTTIADWHSSTFGAPDVTSGQINYPGTVNINYTFLNDLVYGQTYYWAVSTIEGAASESSYSTGSFTIIGGAASATPALLDPANTATVYSLTPTLSWFVPQGTNAVTGYDLKIINSDDAGVLESQTPIDVNGALNQSYQYTGTAGNTYFWKVRSKNASTTSNWSPVFSFTIQAGSSTIMVQPLIGGPNKIQLNTTDPVLSWVIPSKPAAIQKYELLIADNPSFHAAQTYSNLPQPFVKATSLNKSTGYFWKVRTIDGKGNVSTWSGAAQFGIANTATAVEQKSELPSVFELSQNYPNPFNPSTRIIYELPQNSFVSIKVYDMLGREVKTLVNSEIFAGRHIAIWNGDNNLGSKVSSGIYLYRISAGSFISTKKMLLVK